MEQGWCGNLKECTDSSRRKITDSLNLCTDHSTLFHRIKGSFFVRRSLSRSGPGKSASVQLYSSTQIDENTGKGKLSEKAHLKSGKNTKHNGTSTITYKISFWVEPEFGIPAAFVIENSHKHEFFLNFAVLKVSDNRNIHFECNSMVYPISMTNTNRLFFSNSCYLPNRTPESLGELRREELRSLRGNGRGERKDWERIYEYDVYNDLGNPDKSQSHARPVLGGSNKHPYPRRCRTGRPPSNLDHSMESRPEFLNLDVYVPPDERFSPKKFSELTSNAIQAILHFLIPEVKALFDREPTNFESFAEIRNMFTTTRNKVLEGLVMEKLKSLLPKQVFKEIVKASKVNTVKFPVPQIIAGNDLAWKEDEEFGRQMLAGVNPAVIECLRKFPPEGKDGKESSIKASHIEGNLDGLTIEGVMQQWRLFILDHHDYLMPFLNQINAEGVCMYASRTLLFLRQDATLKPLAIELSLPASEGRQEFNQVFLPSTTGIEAALWQLAKAHVAANDSGHHQLISHWLKTHAVVEPFIIATRRQLSSMHPVHRLLNPHFKDTMHINALARRILINSDGVLERTVFTGKISMEISSAIYKDWRFDEQGLPADLLKRRLALQDPDSPSGVRILFEDYPYGADGLEIWVAIKTWVTDYCSVYYANDEDVISDGEIQAWWSEIRRVGHGDKSDENWWYDIKTIVALTKTLTTLIWTASALHASVNFGQYGYAGFMPNRPTLCRKFIPAEGTPEFAQFLHNPDKYFLKMLPEKFETTLGVALVEVLSRHTSEEVYVGQNLAAEWTDNDEVRRHFEKFGENLRQVEKGILERNENFKLKNRRGPAKIPYMLLYPDTSNVGSSKGITGKGIPNSVSI